jgi:hypothetical protein
MLDAAGVFNGGETEGRFVVPEAVAGVIVRDVSSSRDI